MTPVHLFLLGSTIGQIFQPLYEALAWIMAFFYALVPNFAVAIALLTVAVMIVTSPLTVKSTRSTIAMQRLAPELKKIQQKYKGDRATLNDEMMKLYKEHNINPAGGCLPMLIQLPVFVVLYGVIRGLTNTVSVHGHIRAEPRYISPHTRLYANLIAAQGHMKAFGLDLAGTLFSHHASWVGAIPYAAIVLVAIGLQYLQMRQLNSRNQGAAQANPQMQMMQRYMPLIFAIIYLRISAGVNIYFVVSSLCRIGIQEAIFRSGVLDKAPRAKEGVLPGKGGAAPRRRSVMERLAEAQQRALEQQKLRQAGLQADLDGGRRAVGPGKPRPELKPGAPAAERTGTGPGGAGPRKNPPAGSGKPTSGGNGTVPRSPRPAQRTPSDDRGTAAGGARPGDSDTGKATVRGNTSSQGGQPSTKSGQRGPGSKPGGNGRRPGANGTSAGNGAGEDKPAATQSRSARKRPRKAR